MLRSPVPCSGPAAFPNEVQGPTPQGKQQFGYVYSQGYQVRCGAASGQCCLRSVGGCVGGWVGGYVYSQGWIPGEVGKEGAVYGACLGQAGSPNNVGMSPPPSPPQRRYRSCRTSARPPSTPTTNCLPPSPTTFSTLQAVQELYEECQATFDPNNVAALLHQHPYHLDALLTMHDLYRSMGEQASAGEQCNLQPDM